MAKTVKEPLWTKNFIIVSCINFLVILIFYLLMVVIAGYAVEEFGASTSTAGLVASIFIIGSLIARLVSGRLITSWGSRKTFIIGLSFFTFTTVAYFFTGTLSLLIVNRLLHGIATGFVTTAAGTVIAQIIPANRRGEGIGYFSLSAILATAIGPFIGILLTHSAGGFSSIFILNTILVVICFVTFFLVKIPAKVAASKSSEATARGFSLRNYIEPKAVPISFITLFVGFAYSGVMSFMTFYSQEIDLVQAGSLFFLVYSIAVILSRPFTGKMMDRRGANIIIYPALILFAIGMTLFSQATTNVIFLLAACLLGLGYGNFNSVAQTLAIKVTEPHRFGLATSTYFIFLDLGLGAGPYVLGFLVPAIGYRGIFTYMVPVILVSLVLYVILIGRKEKSVQRVVHE